MAERFVIAGREKRVKKHAVSCALTNEELKRLEELSDKHNVTRGYILHEALKYAFNHM